MPIAVPAGVPRVSVNNPVRGQGSPAGIIAVVNPHYACRRPSVVRRNPNPAVIGIIVPITVMINNPSEWFVRIPGPISVGIYPMSVSKRHPIIDYVRTPNISVIIYRYPFTVIIQIRRIIKVIFGFIIIIILCPIIIILYSGSITTVV